ncbi:MAG: GHKL domain-containing protein [Oscillospiraceae bacterium]|nr:GHKL domain-containing protein [Oscillospiraceae bacterium]
MNIWGALFIFFIEALLLFFITKIRFKIVLNYNKNIMSAGITIAGIVFIVYGIIRNSQAEINDFLLEISGIILCGLGLYWWLKKESVNNFNEGRHEIVESMLNEKIESLQESNLYLEKALHTQSKIYPAYQEAIEDLVMETGNPAIRKKAEGIIGEFISDERFLDESRELRQRKLIPTTGMELLDAVFKFYNKKCIQKDIDFDLIIRDDVHKLLEFITQQNLEILAANLIDNAIIACECTSQADKNIVVNLSDSGLSVMDNGIAFEPETLELLGKQRVTTHADSGGSGIGFMTIFEIARACKASVVITGNESFKTVAVWFDGKGEYRVKTEETLLLKQITRNKTI